MELQSAMEYLATYGWAILIIAIIMAVLVALGIFNPVPTQVCQLESGFSCTNYYMYQNGLLVVSILQTTTSPIAINAIGCDTNQSAIAMVYVVPEVDMPIGTNSTFGVQCNVNGVPFTGYVNQPYEGYLQINYTDLVTGFPQVIFGNIAVKVAR